MSNIYPDCTCSQCREYQLTEDLSLSEKSFIERLEKINDLLVKDHNHQANQNPLDHGHGSEVKSSLPEEQNMVDHPPHYTNHPSGVECIEITRHMNFNLGNVIKYLWRCEEKENYLEDLKKAAWYLNDEIETLEKEMI